MASRFSTSTERFYDWPPAKGTLSVALLLGMGSLARELEDVALTAIVTPLAGAALVGPTPAPLVALALAATLTGLVVATALPGRSRRRAAQAGGIGVSQRGVRVVSPAHRHEEPVHFPHSSVKRPGDEETSAELDRLETLAAPEVRWHPGAHEAVARWMAEGFLPSFEDTRSLHLNPAWSPDPRSHEPNGAQRMGNVAFNVWAAILVAGFGALLLGALIQEGTLRDGNWFVLLVFGWIPVVAVPIFVGQAIRAARPVPRGSGAPVAPRRDS